MAQSESFEALKVQQQSEPKRHPDEPNDNELLDDDDEDDDDDDDEGEYDEEEEEEEEEEASQLSCDQAELVTLAEETAPSSSALLSENDQSVGLKVNSPLATHVGVEFKEQNGLSHQEVLGSATVHCAEPQTHSELKSSVFPTSLLELSPTSVTQSISSAASPSLPEQILSPSKVAVSSCLPEADQQGSFDLKSKTVAVVPTIKTPIPDGYNWRKYGQKQVKSPKGSRSYYKCTYSECSAKKIECSDHSGQVIDIVNKGTHTHDPPRRNNSAREGKVASAARPAIGNGVAEHPIRMLKESDPATLSKEPVQEMPAIPDRKRQNSSSSDGKGVIQIKEEQFNEPETKRRLKKTNLECSGTILKSGKKPKFVVHAAGDVGISGDGYRWRKYGQKMVKGNPHPRNYYRCTSAGCPVRKHIETAVDNTNAVIITYKGVHDHDMPVPKKRHGPPSAPLVAAAAPASMNNLQPKNSDALQNQVTSTQWSVGKEGELTAETLDVGADKEKAIESARTLLSIGFEIKPC